MSQNKNEVLYRVYIVLGLLVIFAGFIFYNAVKINVLEGEEWRKAGEKDHIKPHVVKASRGNIITEDGALMASSLPFFDIYFDSTRPSKELWTDANLDSLVVGLMPFLIDDFEMTDYAFRTFYRDSLIRARNVRQQYMRIKKGVSYADYEQIKQLPIFRKGQMSGGFIAEEKFKRDRPYGMLARRTLGYAQSDKDRFVGLEGFFHKELGGSDGKEIKVYKAANRITVPVQDLNSIKPRSGDDIVTTIDVNIQDVVQKALLRGMEHHDAQTGTVIVMEVKTGKIRAMSNIGKTPRGWYEDYNYAIGTKVEPGSTFKLASMMALLEDGYIDLGDSIDLEQGLHTFYEEEMRDASFHQLDSTTIRKAFEISSNVGIAKLVQKYYGDTDDAPKYIQHLRDFRLDQLVGIEINGEDKPYIKEAYNSDDNWSGISLPWMSIGYEVELTPLQLLTFYNAVANNGRMMKPFLVTQVQHFGEAIKTFKPTVIKKQIAKPETIQKVKELLEGVVETGTAKKLKTNRYKFAGKTGTAQINYYKFDQRDNIKYRASFAGYFPAEDPVYSCIVVITEPRKNGRYGSEVAGPIFRQIADKCFIQQKDLYPKENEQIEKLTKKQLPQLDVGYRKDVDKILKKLQLKHTDSGVKNWAVLTADTDTLHIAPRYISRDLVPNVVGMGLRDALYVLENLGLKVTFEGSGKVVQQSLRGGTKIRGQRINLKLR
jgi:cell division protein FtsI (penicillin-binding protein 3)